MIKLSIALPIIAFTGLFGYGSYREASDACEKWSTGGRRVEYLRQYTTWEVLKTPQAQQEIKSKRERLKKEHASSPPKYSPPSCTEVIGFTYCVPARDWDFIRREKIESIDDNVAEKMIQESTAKGIGVITSRLDRRCSVDSLSSRKQILGLEFNKRIDKQKVYIESPFTNPNWEVKKYFRY